MVSVKLLLDSIVAVGKIKLTFDLTFRLTVFKIIFPTRLDKKNMKIFTILITFCYFLFHLVFGVEYFKCHSCVTMFSENKEIPPFKLDPTCLNPDADPRAYLVQCSDYTKDLMDRESGYCSTWYGYGNYNNNEIVAVTRSCGKLWGKHQHLRIRDQDVFVHEFFTNANEDLCQSEKCNNQVVTKEMIIKRAMEGPPMFKCYDCGYLYRGGLFFPHDIDCPAPGPSKLSFCQIGTNSCHTAFAEVKVYHVLRSIWEGYFIGRGCGAADAHVPPYPGRESVIYCNVENCYSEGCNIEATDEDTIKDKAYDGVSFDRRKSIDEENEDMEPFGAASKIQNGPSIFFVVLLLNFICNKLILI